MRKFLRWLVLGLLIISIGLAIAWATSPDPKYNLASFEQEPLVPTVAPIEVAATLAQVQQSDGAIATLLVTGFDDAEATAVDLSALSDIYGFDPFAVLASFSQTELEQIGAKSELRRTYPIADFLTAAPSGERHIGTGTNFPEHAEEASSESVFQFPKFGRAGQARTIVQSKEDVLLDYEVELCMRFDRDIASVEDFDAAVKGIFLCGDFTDRTKLMRLVDIDNLDSCRGFCDAKSRVDFYPAGPFLVIPRDWQGFVAAERFTTRVNSEPRQDARGGEMTLDFRALVEKALTDMDQPRFLYDGQYYHLAPNNRIDADMTLMSGTAEGVIFTQPSRADFIEGGLAYLFSGKWMIGEGPIPTAIETFLQNELESGHFLQPGDVVEHRSSHLGIIHVQVTD
jgi:2-keto-4-pentenoate hydratase/2-oxohepta-3-ene-1,7-dioic acid hydratase in catechol pathway